MAKAVKTESSNFLLEGLWLDGIWTFVLYWRFWLTGALAFMVVLTPVNYFFLNHVNILKDVAHQKPVSYAYWLLLRFIDAAQIYFFTACFLNQQPIRGDDFKPRPADFLYIIGIFLMLVALFTEVWGISIESRVLGAWLFGEPSAMSGADATLTGRSAVIVILAVAIIYVFAVRMASVIPLAVNHIQAPLQFSYELSRGKSLSILANLIVFCLFVGIPVMVSWHIVASLLQTMPATAMKVAGSLFLSFVHSVLEVLCCGLIAAFYYAVTRALYGDYVVANLGVDRRTAPRL